MFKSLVIRFPKDDYEAFENYKKNKYNGLNARSLLIRQFIDKGIQRVQKTGKLPLIKEVNATYKTVHLYMPKEDFIKLQEFKDKYFPDGNFRNQVILSFIRTGIRNGGNNG